MVSLSLNLSEQNLTFFQITICIFISLSFLNLLLKWSSSLSTRNKPHLPPSPPTFPVIGNLHQLGLCPHRSLQALAQIHGPFMLIHLGKVPTLVVSSAEMAREIMKTHDIIFSDRPITKINQILLYDQKDIASAPYGEYWRQMKSVCVLHLLSNKRVQSYRGIREEETDLMVERIKEICSSGLPVNLSENLTRVTNDITSIVTLGRKYSGTERGRSFKEFLEEFLELLGGFDVGDFIPWLGWVSRAKGLYGKAERVAKEFDEFLDRVIDDHVNKGENEGVSKDFLDVLLWIQKEDLAGIPLDVKAIKAIIIDVFAAGTETTSTVSEWIMTELLRHPKIMRRLQNEIREVANNKSDITEDDLNKIPYFKAVIKETFRLHPPIPLLVPRVARQDVKVKGFDIAAGTQVIINDFAIGRDPQIWDRADEFLPERFLNSGIDYKGQNFELLPFGSGRRICPGVQFAVSNNELALAKLLHKFDWELHGVEKLQDLDMTESIGLTIHRKFPLFVVPTPYVSQVSKWNMTQ